MRKITLIVSIIIVAGGVFFYTHKKNPTIKYITIKTGFNFHAPFQDTPWDLRTADGHYLMRIYNADGKAPLTDVLIYDGKEIFHIAQAELNGIALSQNGLHYAYAIVQPNHINDLFVDGQKVISAENLKPYAISNDGKSYLYTTAKQSLSIEEEVLKRNNEELFRHDQGFLEVMTSEDGSSYLAVLRNFVNGNFIESLVYNGQEVYKGAATKERVLSRNGKHSAYLLNPTTIGGSDGEVILDGKVQREGPNFDALQVTNEGHIIVSDIRKGKTIVYVDNRPIPATDEVAYGYGNADASNIVIHDGTAWTLNEKKFDVKTVSPADTMIEIVDNTVYIYTLVQ